MKLPHRGMSASCATLANCERLLRLLKERGPLRFSELAEAMQCSGGALTFYLRRLRSPGQIVVVKKDGSKIRWGLPEHATQPQITSPDDFRIAGRITIPQYRYGSSRLA